MYRHSRPLNLNLFAFHFPLTAIISILHRISGVVIFLLFPLVLWLWVLSLSSDAGFSTAVMWMESFWIRGLLWCFTVGLAFHSIAGIRHLLMDMGWGETLPAAQRFSIITLILFFLLAFLSALWLI